MSAKIRQPCTMIGPDGVRREGTLETEIGDAPTMRHRFVPRVVSHDLAPCADDCPICTHPRLKLAADRAIVLAADAKREAHAARVRKRLAAAGIVVQEGNDGSLWLRPEATPCK